MVTLRDMLELITGPDRVRINRGKEILFTGYKGQLIHNGKTAVTPEILETEVVLFRAELDITARDWKERGLMPPIEPDKLPEYRFVDMQMQLYYRIFLKGEENEEEKGEAAAV